MQKEKSEISRDELDEYIHVAHSGFIIIVAAMVLILLAFIVWGIIGKIPVTETVNGFVMYMDPQEAGETGTEAEQYCIACLDASKYSTEHIREIEDKVTLEMADGTKMDAKVISIYSVPYSRDEISAEYLMDNEWLVEECVSSNYNWLLIIKADNLSGYEYSLTKATLVLDEVSPLSFLVR